MNDDFKKLSKCLNRDGLIVIANQIVRNVQPSFCHAVIGSVFSIQTNNTTWINVISRFNKYLSDNNIVIKNISSDKFLNIFNKLVNKKIFNEQKISGKTKYEVVHQIISKFRNLNINSILNFTDAELENFSCDLEKIHGVGPAINQFILILCGRTDFVKGDTMIKSYVARSIEREIAGSHAAELVKETANKLSTKPTLLDLAIWQFEREFRKAGGK